MDSIEYGYLHKCDKCGNDDLDVVEMIDEVIGEFLAVWCDRCDYYKPYDIWKSDPIQETLTIDLFGDEKVI